MIKLKTYKQLNRKKLWKPQKLLKTSMKKKSDN